MVDTSSQKKLLLVEDDTYIHELYAEILKEEGYLLDEARDGETAYQKMRDNTYDLILLDVMLPKMNGFDILDKLQKDDNKGDVGNKVVLLTNLSQETMVARAVTYGIRGYIVKSDFAPDQLIKEVANYVAQG